MMLFVMWIEKGMIIIGGIRVHDRLQNFLQQPPQKTY